MAQGRSRIVVPQQQLCFGGRQQLQSLVNCPGPPAKTSLGKTLLAEPETLAVIDYDFYGRAFFCCDTETGSRQKGPIAKIVW